MEEKLDTRLTKNFMTTFHGYGNPRAKIWFLGMEEGGGNAMADVQRRMEIWQSRGGKTFDDLRDYHIAIGVAENFQESASGKQPAIQPTWSSLIRTFLLATQNKHTNLDKIDTTAVRQFQTHYWGRNDCEYQTCLIELLPMPSPSVSKWRYKDWVDLTSFPEMKSRKKYRDAWSKARIESISKLVSKYTAEENSPVVIVCYGHGYKNFWEHLSNNLGCACDPGIPRDESKYFDIWRNQTRNLSLVHLVHPTLAIKGRRKMFEDAAKHIKDVLQPPSLHCR